MKVTPSPCLLAPSSITVSEAVKLISSSQSSYLLLYNDDEVVSGIFTNTDVTKYFSQWAGNRKIGSHPLHQVMTKPVMTLSLEDIHLAPEKMVRNKISHIPVCQFNKEQNKDIVIGILTARSLFESIIKLRGIPQIVADRSEADKKRIGVLCGDGAVFNLLEQIFNRSAYVQVDRYNFGKFKLNAVADEIDALVLDVDDIPSRVWSQIVAEFINHPGQENLILVRSDDKKESIDQHLKKFEETHSFRIFNKPIDISKLTAVLEKMWQ